MLYSGNEQPAKPHNPNVNNNLQEVTATGGQKAGFWIMVVLTLGILYIWKITKSNEINRMQIKINESASGIDVQLQKRYDTLTKLVDAVQSQVKFDKETMENIAALRSGFNKASTTEKDQMLSKVSTGLTMAFENYPKLGADESISQMMNEATMIEKEIAASRRLYNSNVTRFNSTIYTFPTCVILSGKGYKGIPLFVADEKSDRKSVV